MIVVLEPGETAPEGLPPSAKVHALLDAADLPSVLSRLAMDAAVDKSLHEAERLRQLTLDVLLAGRPLVALDLGQDLPSHESWVVSGLSRPGFRVLVRVLPDEDSDEALARASRAHRNIPPGLPPASLEGADRLNAEAVRLALRMRNAA